MKNSTFYFVYGMPQTARYGDIIIPERYVMSIIQIHKEDSQTINDISILSVKTIKKISSKIPKIKRKQLLKSEEFLSKLIKRTTYPNFRFFCPYCASLDIFITINQISNDFKVDCLDCKKIWIDSRSWKT